MPKRQKSSKKQNPAEKKPSLTHFLCIPLVTPASLPQLEHSLQKFKQDVSFPTLPIVSPDKASETTVKATEEIEARDNELDTETKSISPLISEQAIRPVGSLHLTLGVMSLDAEKLDQATSLLHSLDLKPPLSPSPPQTSPSPSSPTLETPKEPLKISLKSLYPMQAPHKTSILYTAPEDTTNRLEPLCLFLKSKFTEAGLLIPDSRPLRLHATIVNTIYIKGRKSRRKKSKGREVEESKKAEEKEVEGKEEGKGAIETAHRQDRPATEQEPLPEHQDRPSDPAPASANSAPSSDPQTIRPNEPASGHGPDAKSPYRIDATALLPRYASFTWAADFDLDRIAICEMGVKKTFDKDGKVVGEAYREVGVRML